MSFYTITSIPDPFTLAVSPGWTWRGQRGALLSPVGPEGGGHAGKALSHSLVGRTVTIGRAYWVSESRLVCEVFIDGVPLAARLTALTA